MRRLVSEESGAPAKEVRAQTLVGKSAQTGKLLVERHQFYKTDPMSVTQERRHTMHVQKRATVGIGRAMSR